jgi:hypothetical protein
MKTDQPKPCDEPKFIDHDDGVALVIKDYARRTDNQFLLSHGETPENDSDDLNILSATMALLLIKKNINRLRGRLNDFGDSVDFDRPISVAQRTDYGSDSFEAGLTKSFDLIDVMMAAQQLADELQELVDDWWDSIDDSDEPNSQPPPAEERPPSAGEQGSLFESNDRDDGPGAP